MELESCTSDHTDQSRVIAEISWVMAKCGNNSDNQDVQGRVIL